MWSSSSVRRSGASGSACSRTACTSDPNVAPTGRSAIGDATASVGTAAAAAAPVTSSSSLATTSGSLATPPTGGATTSTALSEEYDARRQVRSTDRVNGRADSGGTSARSGSAPGSGWTAGSGARTARGAPPLEELGRLVVGQVVELRRDLRHPRPPAEDHPLQRAGRSVPGRSPPADHLGLGTGDRDVEKAQPLAALLVSPATHMVVPVGPTGTADGHAAVAVLVMEERSRGLGDVAVSEGGEVDDGVLQPLARVDGDQLYGGRVGVEPSGSLDAPSGPALGDLPAQPGQHGHQPEPFGERHLVQSLADVPEVGELPLATDQGEHPGRQPASRRSLQNRRDTAGGEQLGPRPQRCRRPRR